MKKRVFIALFVSVHLLFIGLHIDKQSRLVKLSYKKQLCEQKLTLLQAKKQELVNHLHALQNHQKLKSFAKSELGMEPLFLKNLKHLPKNEIPAHECNE